MDKKFLKIEYNNTISKAWESIFKYKNINKAISFCDYAGYLAWIFPFLENFSDDNLENIILEIAKYFNPIEYMPSDKKVVFYNSQIIDSGALTEQYLDFFIKNDYQILFIIVDNKNIRLGKSILNKINNTSNVKLFISQKRKNVDKIIDIRHQLDLFKAKYCFLHLLPNDVIGCISFLNISIIKTYYIVHNDHTFWIGKLFFDYYIEFRHFGISLAIERRGIPTYKLLHIPYYPIKNDEAFKGFPFDRKDKIVGISGANLYKYLIDPELKYFKVIKELITEYPNFVFCLCGIGENQPIIQFIETNNLQKRFFFLGYRTDFYNLIGKADILFESYPFKGGLTPLFATEQKIPVVGISSYDNCSGSLEELLNIEGYRQPANFTEFKAEASKLITDSKYRLSLGSLLSNNKNNKKDFEIALKKVINDNLEDLKPKKIKHLKLNEEANLQEYINLSESTIENLMYAKLFILKSSLPLFNRIKLLIPALKASKTKEVKGVSRVVFLVLTGR